MAKLEDKVTVDYLRESFDYNPDTGELFWKEDRPRDHFKNNAAYLNWKRSCSGKQAGCVAEVRKGIKYIIVKIGGVRTGAHRIAFIVHHGYFPNIIDHLNGDGLNNKIENLIESNNSHNAKNQKLNSRNTTGISGVYWVESHSKWAVKCNLTVDGKRKNIGLGWFDTIFEAACVRISWLNANGYSSRHGT